MGTGSAISVSVWRLTPTPGAKPLAKRMITRAQLVLLCATVLVVQWSAPAADKSGVSPTTISVPKGPGSIEGLGESFQPHLNSGTAKYGVKLSVPPGTAGHTPSLSLRYEGGAGNSILGFGWNLPFPYVQRQTDRGIPTYGRHLGFLRDDRFINEMKEELVPTADGFYFCENEGAFLRYRQVGEHWEATTPFGTRLQFGLTPQARVRNGTDSFCWLLERQTDTRGNTITYSYVSFPSENNTNEVYLKAIRYGPGAPPWTDFHFVIFHYEDRPDWFEDCRSGFVVRTGKRLKSIVIGTQGPQLTGQQTGDFDEDGRADNLIRRYELRYKSATSALRWSLLETVTQIGADGITALPPARFDYQICEPPLTISAAAHVITSENTPPFVMDNPLVDLIDLNGDALPDLLKTDSGGGSHTAYLNLGQRTGPAGRSILWQSGQTMAGSLEAQTFDLQSDENTGTHGAHLADMDGDGAADFAVKAGTDNVFYFANQNSRAWGSRRQMVVQDFAPPAPFGSPGVRTADIDFDKRIDIIRSLGAGSGYHVWFNLTNSSYSERILVEPETGFSFDFNSPAVQIVDFNGDRVPDIAQVQQTAVTVTTGLGYGRFTAPKLISIPGGIVLTDQQLSRARLSDLNSDGLADLVVERAEGTDLWYWLNLGTYVFDEQRTITGLPVPVGSAAQIRWADINGNGTVDYIFADRESTPAIQAVDLGELIGCGSSPNVLRTMANGIGRVTHVGYRPSTEFRLLDAAAGNPWPDPTPFPVPVVNAVTNFDSLGHAYVTLYRYHDGYYDPQEKQFRGFARVEQIEIGDSTAPTLVSRSHFDTGRTFEIMKGKLVRATAEADDGRVFQDSFTSWQLPPRVLALGTNGAAVNYTHPVGSTNIITELGQGLQRRMEFEMAYDNFGNQTLRREYGVVEGSDRRAFDDERFTVIEYAMNTNAWIVRHPKRQEIRDGMDRVVSRAELFYDDETFSANNPGAVTIGNLTLKREWISPSNRNDVVLAMRAKYDSYGNATSILDPLATASSGTLDMSKGHIRIVEFDGRFHTFQVSEAVHVGDGSGPLVFRATYNEGFGTVTSTLDFNTNQTTYGYDQFGRISHIISRGDSTNLPTTEYSYVLAASYKGTNLINYVETRQLDRPTNSAGPKRDLYFIARQFTDGLGRKLLTKHETGPDTEGGLPRVVVNEAITFNQRQATARSFNSFYSRLTGPLDEQLAFESVEAAEWSGDFQRDGRLVTLSLSNAHFTSFHYDATLREIKTINPDATMRYTVFEPLLSRFYDENDADPASPHFDTPKVQYTDGLGRLVRVDEITRLNDDGLAGNTLRPWTTRYEYDANDQLTGIVDSQNNTKRFTYDGLTRKTFMNDPDRGVMDFAYDDAGNLVETIDAKRQRNTYTYDGANRIRTEDYHDEAHPFSANLVYHPAQPLTRENRPDVVYFYDRATSDLPAGDGNHLAIAHNTAGRLAYVWDLSGEEHISFDERGRVEWVTKRISDPQFEVALNAAPSPTFVSYRTAFSYDSLDRITAITYPDNDAVTYEFDDRTLPNRIIGSGSGTLIVSNISYWPSDQQAEINFGNGIRTTYAHDNRQRLKTLLTARPTAVQDPLVAFDYDFDGVSNIRRIGDKRPGSSVPEGNARRNTQILDYDDAYRLERVRYSFGLPGQPIRNDGEITYRYDRIGNLLAQSSSFQHFENGIPVADLGNLSYGGTAGATGRAGRTAGDAPGPHALTAIVAATNNAARGFEYDANGNVTVMDGLTNTWDFRDRLVAVENSLMRAVYRYDHDDHRVLKRVEYKPSSSSAGAARVSTVYPNKHFEVREHEAPTKYVFNGDTRLARITGTLAPANLRIQRLRFTAGWNLSYLAVTATNAVQQLSAIVESGSSSILKWDDSARIFLPASASEVLDAGTVIWVRARTNAVVSIFGRYEERPTRITADPYGRFFAGYGFQPVQLTNQPVAVHACFFSPAAQQWKTKLPEPLTNPLHFPPVLDVGTAFFARSDVLTDLKLPPASGSLHYYHQDHLGSSTCVTDADGNVVEESAFYPFGYSRCRSQFGSGAAKYLFSQKEKDEESGLIYFESRFLASTIARYTRVDGRAVGQNRKWLSNPQKLNPYVYCRNNPINFTDPDGFDDKESVVAPMTTTTGGGAATTSTSGASSGFKFSDEGFDALAVDEGVGQTPNPFDDTNGYCTGAGGLLIEEKPCKDVAAEKKKPYENLSKEQQKEKFKTKLPEYEKKVDVAIKDAKLTLTQNQKEALADLFFQIWSAPKTVQLIKDGKCLEAAEEMGKTKDTTQAVKDRFKERADRFKEDCPSVSVGTMTTTTSGGAATSP